MKITKIVWPSILAVSFGALAICSYCSIGPGQVGVVTTFGKIDDRVLLPGANWLNPLSFVHKINTMIETTNEASEAASKDLQMVNTKISVNYHVGNTDIVKFYARLGNRNLDLQDNVIDPAINEAFKSQVALFTAEELIEKRNIVTGGITKTLSDKLKQYNIIIDSINVTDFQFSEEFNKAIELKVTAQQSALKAENDLQRIKIEAQQKIVQAQADAQAMNLRRMSVTPELIELKKLEVQQSAIAKWDGQLPKTIAGGQIPLILGNPN